MSGGGKLEPNACGSSYTGSTDPGREHFPAYFLEGGLNLSGLFPGQCFRASARSSATRQLALGERDLKLLVRLDRHLRLDQVRKQAQPSDGTQFGYTAGAGLPGDVLAWDGGVIVRQSEPGSYR